MFDRLRKALGRELPGATRSPAPASSLHGPVSQWAAAEGLQLEAPGAGSAFGLSGSIGGRPWRMELGRPTRKFIRGQELRARAELGIDPSLLVLVLNRPLKEALEKQAYALFTDDLRTSADPNLPEEMRLVAMAQETGWSELPSAFWRRWSVVAEDPALARKWIDVPLARRLMDWPVPLEPQVPFLLMLLRGKAYLRMEQGTGDLALVQHAAALFTAACENALDAFTTPG